jgi:hypothetical protein
MPALSPVKKESVGLGGSRMSTKENKVAKAGRPCSWECYEKNETYCYSEIFFLDTLINVKADRVKIGRQESTSRALRWTGLAYVYECADKDVEWTSQ